ncbi:unnamed protein product, partial [Medioppia subpectinata]
MTAKIADRNNNEMMLRGSTPPSIKEKCYDLCRDYLGGVWLNVTVDDIEVKRLSGGLTNQSYYCALNEDKRHDISEDIPQEIMKYYKHKWFEMNDQKNPILIQELAQKLARIHSTVVPIKKTENWIFKYFDDSYNKAYKLFDINALINECNCKTLKTHDLKQELEWMKDLIIKTDSPMTFSHLDFRGCNVMITETDGIVICDFEYGCYGCRGFDFGSLFGEWGRKWGDFMTYVEFPDDNTIRPFIEFYIKESTKIVGEKGSTPPSIKEKCYDLCRDYLGGVWLNVTVDDIEVKRLSGGLTNQSYYCALNERQRNDSSEDKPQEVLIRLYQEKHFNNSENERFNDTIISTIMFENGLGPKVMFFIKLKHKWFELNDQKNPILVQELAQKLAKIHLTVVPIKKTENWIFKYFDDSYNKAYKLFDINALIDECNCETLKTHDLKQELEWMKDLIIKTDSPVTFTHLDFRGSNIMITETDGIVICDFEYVCYGCRGFDLGALFAEWGRKCGEYMAYVEFPDDNTIRPFIESYIEESIDIFEEKFTNDTRNTFQHILKETKKPLELHHCSKFRNSHLESKVCFTMWSNLLLIIMVGLLVHESTAGPFTYGACQTACNAGWVLCCSIGGGVAGTYTVVGAAAVLAECSKIQGACMAALIRQLSCDSAIFKLQRGSTPDSIQDSCFLLCREYLGGVWLNVTVGDIEVKRLSGGLTNQLYYCAVNEDKRTINDNVPQEVAILLYQNKHFNHSDINGIERLTDVIIAQSMSDKGLGPKIYGLFASGQILKYYKHRSFRVDEQKNPKLVRELAQKLARLHSTSVPIKKFSNWIPNYFDEYYSEANSRFELQTLYEECNCETFKTHDLDTELEWLKKLIVETDSPVMFTHVDLRGSNIMVTETDGIVLCDFEYSCNDYRGFDFGTLFTEWDVGYEWGVGGFTDDNNIIPFIESYIEESVKIVGQDFARDERNSLKHIMKEVKVTTENIYKNGL